MVVRTVAIFCLLQTGLMQAAEPEDSQAARRVLACLLGSHMLSISLVNEEEALEGWENGLVLHSEFSL